MDITVTISDVDVKALSNDLADINSWVQEAVKGKIYACKTRLIAEWQPKLFEDPEVNNIPADDAEFINFVVARDDYKNKAQRQSEE